MEMRYLAHRLFATVGLSAVLTSACGTSPAERGEAAPLGSVQQPSSGATITSDVAACSVTPGDPCAVGLDWDTTATGKAQVWVSVDGAAATIMSCTPPQGSKAVPWIQHDRTYRFSLHPSPSCDSSAQGAEAAAVTVRGTNTYVTRVGTELRVGGKPFHRLGMAKVDLFHQFLGIADADVSQATTALDDAQAHGIGTLAVMGAPFWPGDLDLWVNSPAAYWAAFDSMLAAAAARNITIVPTIWFNEFVFSDSVDAPLADVFQVGTAANQLLHSYAQDIASRYANDTTILYWNLAFQQNLRADTDFSLWPTFRVDVAEGTRASRGASDNFTTDQLINLMQALAETVRAADPHHLISTGFGPPKEAAEGYRAQPEWSGGPAWPADTDEQMYEYVRDTHPDPIDIVSVNVTNAPSFSEPYAPTNQILDHLGDFDPGVIRSYAQAASEAGKPLAVSMAWDSNPTVATDARGNFARRAMIQVLESGAAMTFLQMWEMYVDGPSGLEPWPTSIEPTTSPSQMNDLIDFFQTTAGWVSELSNAAPVRLGVPYGNLEWGNAVPLGWSQPPGSSAPGQADPTSAFDGSQSARIASGEGLESLAIDIAGLDELILSAALHYPTSPTGSLTMQLIPLDWEGTPMAGHEHTHSVDLADGGGYRVEALRASLHHDAYQVRIRFQVTGDPGFAANVDDIRLTRLPAVGESCPDVGRYDTCSERCPCKWGWGDCDSNAECAVGLVCKPNSGSSFGMSPSTDVCLPAHCSNAQRDANVGETGVDDGGPCGEPEPVFEPHATKFGFAVFDATSRSMEFAKQHSSLLFLAQPEAVLHPVDFSWPAPLIVFAGPTKSYAQYRKLLFEGSAAEQNWLAGLDDIRRRASRHPAFLYTELNSYRVSSLGPNPHRITPPRPFDGADFPERFKLNRRLLTAECCDGKDYDQCNKDATLCGPAVPLATFQAPNSQQAVANLARFYVEHFEPESYAPFAEINITHGEMQSVKYGNPSGGEWDGFLKTYQEVLLGVRALYEEADRIPIFPTWQWEFMTGGTYPHPPLADSVTLMEQVYGTEPFDRIGISTYPAGFGEVDGELLIGRRFATFADLEAIGPAYFTDVRSQVSLAGLATAPLVVAESGWPGRNTMNHPQDELNQRDFVAWLLGPLHEFSMVQSYFGVDPRYPAAALGDPPCASFDLSLGLVTSSAYGLRPRPALHVVDSMLYASLDSDSDGIADDVDNCPYTSNSGQQDSETPVADGIGDACDNCVSTYNPSQLDGDVNGYGNACDGDFDENGSINGLDRTILVDRIAGVCDPSTDPAGNQTDLELDLDGNGVVDNADLTVFDALPASPGPSGYTCAGTPGCPNPSCAANPSDPCQP